MEILPKLFNQFVPKLWIHIQTWHFFRLWLCIEHNGPKKKKKKVDLAIFGHLNSCLEALNYKAW